MALITGTGGNDNLDGGNDLVKDTLQGGEGSDTYVIHNIADIIDEDGTGVGDVDTIQLASNFNLLAYALNNSNIEVLDGSLLTKNMKLTGNTATSTTVTGGSGADSITGGTAVDTLVGGSGNDTLNGGNDAVADSLVGGNGDDTYILNDTNDIIVDANGANILKLNSTFSDDELSLQETVDYNYTAANIAKIDASAIALATKNLTLTGNAASSTHITGGAGNDSITGGTAIDTLIGGNGNDTLNGGIDVLRDSLVGGEGSDTYVIHDSNDTIVEAGKTKGNIDTIKLAADFTPVTYTLNNAAIEALDASDLGALRNMTLTGNAKIATTIIGGSGADIIVGGAGNDSLMGGIGTDSILGGVGNDTLAGGTDEDTLVGGVGNDTYIIGDTNDTITELPGGGTDTIMLVNNLNNIDLTAYNNIENADASGVSVSTTINGNTLANKITGSANNDILYGGNDTLADTLVGGSGDDTYILKDTKDIITDTVGSNKIELSNIFTGSELKLAGAKGYNYSLANIDEIDASALASNLTLIGNAAKSTTITGGSGNDTITGGTGDNSLIGGSGDDSLIGGAGKDTILGGIGNDTLYGGLDTIRDSLLGGNDNDTYILRDTSDRIIDTVGSNTISLGADFLGTSLSLQETSGYNYTVANIDKLDATAVKKALSLTGNDITATTIVGGSGNDTITGGTAIDTLLGGAGADMLYGGNDALADSLVGGVGDDTYIIQDLNDIVVESSNGGNDTLKLTTASAFASFSLSTYDDVENIDASALVNHISLTGNNLANKLIGTGSSDTLTGGNEADTLIGGRGSDLYYVKSSKNKIIEESDGGYDAVVLDSNYDSSSCTVSANIEFIDATAVKKDMTIANNSASAIAIFATDNNDKITGGSGNDTIMGFYGNDNINGGAGNDYLDGGMGKDTIYGGGGNDFIYGGDDTVADVLSGGDGQDDYSLRDTRDIISDTSGGNSIRLRDIYDESGFSLASKAVSDDGTKYNYSGVNITMLDAHHVNTHGLVLSGSDATSTVYTSSTVTTVDPVTFEEKTTTVTTVKNEPKDILIYGTKFDDTVISYGGDDTLWGGFGSSKHYGAGNDVIYGGAGSNTLLGGIGNDTYLIDGTATDTKIIELTDTDEIKYGTDTIKLISTSGTFDLSKINNKGKLNNLAEFSVSLVDYANVENIDGSLIESTNLILKGNDLDNTITGGAGNDTISSTSGKNVLFGGNGNDSMSGGSDNDVLHGDAGNDTLFGGTGVNTLYGGSGDDVYQISIDAEESIDGNDWNTNTPNHWPTRIPNLQTTISDTQGIDKIVVIDKSSYADDEANEQFVIAMPFDTLSGGGIEDLDASAVSYHMGLNITGNALDNYIIGGTGWDTINTGDGDDTVIDDKFYTDSNGTIWYTGNDIDVGDGNNRVITGISGDDITAGSGDDFVYDLGGDNIIDVGAGNNRVYTGAGDDIIRAGIHNDYIFSGDGNDYINAGTGFNTLLGGAGDDVYVLNSDKDLIIENPDSGTDMIQITQALGLTECSLDGYDNIEGIDASLYNTSLTLTGNSGDNVFKSGSANDRMIGLGGNDTYLINDVDDVIQEEADGGIDTIELGRTPIGLTSLNLNSYQNVENIDGHSSTLALNLTGNAVANKITGGEDHDTIDGGAGVNTLIGGDGDDVYMVNDFNDVITEKIDEGSDTLRLSAAMGLTSFNLNGYANVENLDASSYTTGIELTGNDADNILTGGSDVDTLIGGVGNDTYFVTEANDEIIENLNEGNDTLKLSSDSLLNALNLNNYTNIENIDGSLSSLNLTLTGNIENNILISGDGIDNLVGGLGDDTYIINNATDRVLESAMQGTDTIRINGASALSNVNLMNYTSVENLDGSESTLELTLTGNTMSNVITGNNLGGILDGGTGADTLIGGTGDDNYIINIAEDVIVENVNGGTDTATISSNSELQSVDLANYANVEKIDGAASTKALLLRGNDLNNTLIGGNGEDTLVGGLGDDTYVIKDDIDSINEDAGAGSDTIRLAGGSSLTSIDLREKYPNIENLDGFLVGGTVTFIGNENSNIFTGGSGNDVLDAREGNDTLTGGAGNDTYTFRTKGDRDLITSTDAGDIINIDTTTGITTQNMLFYTDTADNLFIDYTSDAKVGDDIVEIMAETYDDNTIIRVDSEDILISTIIQFLGATGSAYNHLNDAAISNFIAEDKLVQSASLAIAVPTWT